MSDLARNYFYKIKEKYDTGQTTEQSFYGVLEIFIEQISSKLGMNVLVIQIPKKTESGLPDFLILRRVDKKLIGRIEAKTLDMDLTSIAKTSQLVRYKEAFPNLILTNYSSFMFFRDGRRIDEVKIHDMHSFLESGRLVLNEDRVLAFEKNMTAFLRFTYRRITTPKTLAIILARKTHILKEIFLEEAEIGENSKKEFLIGLFNMFQETLNKSMTLKQFVDLIAQTITYGLFFAKTELKEKDLELEKASWSIPKSIPILQNLFYNITSPQRISEHMAHVLRDVINILNNTDMNSIFEKFHSEKWTDDPAIHFYETFLKEYDPEVRVQRGIFYTPVPIVSYIINSIHSLLKSDFNLQDGLANSNVTLLDPAAGTLTFPLLAIKRIKEELKDQNKEGLFNSLIREHVLKNFYAFELLLAPYTIAHFKASLTLKDLGYNITDEDRFNLYLTNSLEIEEISQRDLYFLPLIAKESREAVKVKEKVPVLVVCANPPYFVRSENKSDFIEGLMEDYKKDVKKEERNIQPLSDDYIKFIRFAQWKIEQVKDGIIGYITNNEYLSGLIHRGMRKELLRTFDRIYILNLHGDLRKGDALLGNRKDENVFDIRKGVAIALFIKNATFKKKGFFYADSIGSQEGKYKYLLNNNVLTTKWTLIKPENPYYFFIPRKIKKKVKRQYEKFPLITDIFKKYACGIKTHRDKFVVTDTREELEKRLKNFVRGEVADKALVKKFGLKDTNTWKIEDARLKLRETGIETNKLRVYNYRPFCVKWTYLSNIVMDRPRGKEIHDVDCQNPAIITTRQLAYLPFQHVFITDKLPDICLISLRTKESSYVFPLCLLKNKKKISNIKDSILQRLKSTYDKNVKPMDVFHYIYAILHSNKFRSRYAKFLKIGFPRIPLTSDFKLFSKLGDIGQELIDIHLLNFESKEEREVGYPIDGINIIQKSRYDEKNHRIYINNNQYFEGVLKEEWDFHVGGHQVLGKWLKEMKGEKLSSKRIRHFIKIIASIKKTTHIVHLLDEHYDRIEESTVLYKATPKKLTHFE